MAVDGVIFDADGTLIDSVAMWKEVVPRVLGQYTSEDISEHMERSQTVPLDTAMKNFVEAYEVDVSVEELTAHMKREVQKGYKELTHAYEDTVSLVKELYAAHIPIAVASCTSYDELVVGLKTHGLFDYFDTVISAADGYPGKEEPDVFIAAAEALSTPRATTWVIEDALVAARSAQRAGFPVVGLIREGNWGDTSEFAEFCEIAKRSTDPFISLEELKNYPTH